MAQTPEHKGVLTGRPDTGKLRSMLTLMEPTVATREQRKPIKRSGTIRLRIAPDVVERMDRIAALYGVPRATLCTMAIGEFVTRHEKNLQMHDKLVSSMGGEFAEQLRIALGRAVKEQGGE